MEDMGFFQKAIYLMKKWDNQNEGATTEELKELKKLLPLVLKDVERTIKEREEEDVLFKDKTP